MLKRFILFVLVSACMNFFVFGNSAKAGVYDYLSFEQQRKAESELSNNRFARLKMFDDWRDSKIELGMKVDPLEVQRMAMTIAGGDSTVRAMLPVDYAAAEAYAAAMNRKALKTRSGKKQ